MISQGYGKSVAGNDWDPSVGAYLADNDLGLYIVSDGVGGQVCGELASALTVRAAAEHVDKQRDVLNGIRSAEAPEEKALKIAEEALLRACAEVYGADRTHSDCESMGSTATLVLMLGNKAVMAHVGDTRLYLHRGGKVHKLSQDHTVIAEYVRMGTISETEANDHVFQNILTRSLGKHRSTVVDTLLFDLLPQDRLLLCSNGLRSAIRNTEELAPFFELDFETIADSIVDHVASLGGSDDMTAVVIRPSREFFSKLRSAPSYRPIDKYFNLLDSVQIFEDLSFRQLQRIINLSQIEYHDAGKTLFREEHYCPGMIVVLEGSVSMTRQGEQTGVLNAGDSAQEISLICERPSHSTYTTLEPSRILLLERDVFRQFTRQFPRIGMTVLGRLSERLANEIDSRTEESWRLADSGMGFLNM